jgi:DNA-binding NarL/FixJ family response regulator
VGETVELDGGRAAFRRRAWVEAHARLSAVDATSPLDPEDLERLATACYLIGRRDEGVAVWSRAFSELVARGEPRRAARCGFWLAFGLFNSGGDVALAGGWIAKAVRQLEAAGSGLESAEHGYVAVVQAIPLIYEGDAAGAEALAADAAALGERCADTDLVAFARCVQGRALMRQGHTAEGMSLLDEVMVAVVGDEVTPLMAGDLYCAAIEGCQEAYDLRRAQEWTAALTRWCDAQPDLVPYRGQCLVHRAEIMLLRGSWPDADESARAAHVRLAAPPPHPAAGAASYLEGELCRLRGAYAEAETFYREASTWGRQPQPGLALLRLAQGRVDAAQAAIRRVLAEPAEPAGRPVLLAAAVEILLAAGDARAAADAAENLSALAGASGAALPGALAAQARGAVRAAAGTPDAVAALREAWAAWHRLQAPYEAARVRELIGLACRAAGDEDTALMELDAAASVFARLGAAPDLARVRALTGGGSEASSPLTARETEVLRLVATGASNRQIAGDLFLSEKTVARHVSNILAKLDVRSRAAATAYAYEHGLV